jgi:hypothetical protein
VSIRKWIGFPGTAQDVCLGVCPALAERSLERGTAQVYEEVLRLGTREKKLGLGAPPNVRVATRLENGIGG